MCGHCDQKHGIDKLEALRLYGMRCPTCGVGTCTVTNLSRKYESLIRSVERETLLPATELGILHTLHSEGKEMFAANIAAELDCSYQLIGRRGRYLSERGLVRRSENESGRRTFEIAQGAEETYFSDLEQAAKLNVPE